MKQTSLGGGGTSSGCDTVTVVSLTGSQSPSIRSPRHGASKVSLEWIPHHFFTFLPLTFTGNPSLFPSFKYL
jgi:hypothetical protein